MNVSDADPETKSCERETHLEDGQVEVNERDLFLRAVLLDMLDVVREALDASSRREQGRDAPLHQLGP